MANDIIDIVVTDNSDNVTINATPNLITINVTNTSGNIIGSNYYLASTFAALPIAGDTTILYVVSATSLMYRWNGSAYVQINSIGSVAWGGITGTLSSQTDLQTALNLKYNATNPSGYITGITSGNVTTALGFTPVGGSGTTNTISKFTSSAVLGNSNILDTSSLITLNSNSYVNGNLRAGVVSDAGYRLDVAGLSRITGTTESDSPPLGSELLTSSNWTSIDWTGGYTTGFTHTTGNTSVLSNTLAAVIGTYYKVQFTVTNRTAGSFTVGFGGETRSISATRSFEPLAITTGNLTITPTSDFNGTIIVSVKTIGLASPTLIINPTTNNTPLGIRATSTSNNTVIGYQAGQRLSNSGVGLDGANNTFIGANAGRNTTTSRSTLFIGVSAGEFNVTGTDNIGIGNSALLTNKTGNENTAVGHGALTNNIGGTNCAFGQLSLQLNTTGNLNVAIGANALQNNTTGSSNSVLGQGALRLNTTGSNNIAIGKDAGRNIASGADNTIVNTSIFIGDTTRALADNQQNQIVIGVNSIGLGSNTTVLGNSGTVTTAIYGDLLLGGTTPITSAMLAMTSTTEGFLPPRMTTTQKNAIATPATGLVIFDTTLGKLCVFSTTWQTITSV